MRLNRTTGLLWLERLVRPWRQAGGWPYLLICGVMLLSSLVFAADYAGIASLYGRDQGYTLIQNGPILAGNVTYTHLVPYLNYPLEYPFMGGLMMLVVNAIGYANPPPLQSIWIVLYMSSLMMAAFACFVAILWARAGVPAYKALLLFALNPAVLAQFDVTFDMVGVFLLLGSVYALARGRRGWSAVSLGLSAGVKGFPLLALPLLAWYAHLKQPGDDARFKRGMLLDRHETLRYWLTCGGVFGGGMLFQYALSPTNFFRAGSYLTAYGVEGSWLGLLIPSSIVDYEHWATWSSWIGSGSTVLHLFQPIELVSIGLILAALLAVWRRRATMAPKTAVFLVVSAVVLLWWWSPPQFLFYPMGLLPLVTKDFKTSLALTTGFSLFGTFPLWIRLPLWIAALNSYDWVLISTGYQACLAVFLLYELGVLRRLSRRLTPGGLAGPYGQKSATKWPARAGDVASA